MSRATVIRRRLVAGGLLAAALFAGYMLWFRDSSLFEITEVEVTGVTADKSEVTASLEAAAREMTTLHVRDDELRRAVEGFPTIASIEAHASLFHRLEIEVSERLPVAVAKLDGELQPVSEDGYVLEGVPFDPDELPSIVADSRPGGRLDQEGTAQAAIVGAAPKALRDRLRSAGWDPERGVVVALSGAPELRFGDGERAEQKWRALAAVLAAEDPGSLAYVDVSVPERPVAA